MPAGGWASLAPLPLRGAGDEPTESLAGASVLLKPSGGNIPQSQDTPAPLLSETLLPARTRLKRTLS